MDLLDILAKFIEANDFDEVRKFHFNHCSSLQIDTESCLRKLSSFQTDDVASSILPLNHLTAKENQTAVPVW